MTYHIFQAHIDHANETRQRDIGGGGFGILAAQSSWPDGKDPYAIKPDAAPKKPVASPGKPSTKTRPADVRLSECITPSGHSRSADSKEQEKMSITSDMIGKYVVVRTFSAGVHVGTLVAHEDTKVILANASRIWRWRGANTLSEISLHGIDESYSRISEQVPELALTEAIEIIPCSKVAAKNLQRPRWGV